MRDIKTTWRTMHRFIGFRYDSVTKKPEGRADVDAAVLRGYSEVCIYIILLFSLVYLSGFRDMHMQRKRCSHSTYTKVLRQKT